MGKSPYNPWLQGPGVGLELVAGATMNLWPEQLWLAKALFLIGLLLIVSPIAAWFYTRRYSTAEIKHSGKSVRENPLEL